MTIHGLTVGHAPLSNKPYTSTVDNYGRNNKSWSNEKLKSKDQCISTVVKHSQT